MKKLTFIILILITIIGCSEKGKSEIEKFTFYSAPSFYSGFKIEIDNNSKKVIASIHMNIFLQIQFQKILGNLLIQQI